MRKHEKEPRLASRTFGEACLCLGSWLSVAKKFSYPDGRGSDGPMRKPRIPRRDERPEMGVRYVAGMLFSAY